jgi:hypothetical protein
MPRRILAVLDESLANQFCNGTASEHHDAEQKLQVLLRGMLREQAGDTTFSIEGAPVAGGNGVVDLELTAEAVLAIRELQGESGAKARVVKVDFWPGEFRLLVLVHAHVYHVSSSGETRQLLR